jgi:hypothetical protein
MSGAMALRHVLAQCGFARLDPSIRFLSHDLQAGISLFNARDHLARHPFHGTGTKHCHSRRVDLMGTAKPSQ